MAENTWVSLGLFHPYERSYTPRKTNIEPQNRSLEDDFPFERGDFQVPC